MEDDAVSVFFVEEEEFSGVAEEVEASVATDDDPFADVAATIWISTVVLVVVFPSADAHSNTYW